MNRREMTEIIATRSVQVLHPDGETEVIDVEIGRPAPGPEGTFYSPYRIYGAGVDTNLYGGGVDEIDALQAAMIMIRIYLEHLRSDLNWTISWKGGEAGDLGFPRLADYGR